jgi:hypothetical protein
MTTASNYLNKEKHMNWLIILSLKAILSSIIGSSFYQWFQKTKMGIWFQQKIDNFMQYLAVKYDIEVAKKDAKFRKQYPLIAEKLDNLEKEVAKIKKKK